MRRLLTLPLFALALLVAACAPADDAPPAAPVAPADYDVYGDAFAAEDALAAEAVIADREAYLGQTVTVRGTVHQVCQMAGCWLTFDGGAAGGLRIRVPRGDDGYVFTVPTDISGREVIVRGTVEAAELDAETQAHLAEDAGEEAAPTAEEARKELQMTASGVLVRKA